MRKKRLRKKEAKTTRRRMERITSKKITRDKTLARILLEMTRNSVALNYMTTHRTY